MVTVGMNYEIIAGKESQFEAMFNKVLEIMSTTPGHGDTVLYSGVLNKQMYLIVSRWSDRASFDAFTSSDQFNKVVDWGKEKILASRPKHDVYGDTEPTDSAPAGCPVAH